MALATARERFTPSWAVASSRPGQGAAVVVVVAPDSEMSTLYT